jgi:hypothetical protein
MIFDFVATGGPSDSFGVGFLWAVGADNTDVGGLFVFRNFVFENEKTGFGTAGHGRIGTKTLEHTSNFFGIGRLPFQSVAAFAEGFVFDDHASFRMHGGTMHGQILDEVGGSIIGVGRFVDTWATSFGGLGKAGLAAKALGALVGLLGNWLVGGGADRGCRVSTLVTLEAGCPSGVGGLAVLLAFLSLRCCLQRRMPAIPVTAA